MRIELPKSLVAPGESWAAAVERLAGPLSRPVLARDLSHYPLIFGTDEENSFAIRAMTEGDFGDLARWIAADHVARWWDGRDSPEQIVADFGPGVRGEDPTRYWIWEVNGRSIGFSQDYRIAEHPDFALLCGSPEAIGFDYAIGEPAFIDRGMGTSLLWVYLRDMVVPAYAEATELFAAPDHRNYASRRVLAKVGATEGLWFDEPNGPDKVSTVIGCSIDVGRVMATSVTDG